MPTFPRALGCSLLLLLTSLCGGSLVFAQDSVGASKLSASECQKNVLRFQEDLKTLSDSLGEESAKRFQADFLPPAQWNEVLLSEGYCGLSTRLREKRLVR